MKQKLIVGAAIILLLFASARHFFSIWNKIDDEMKSYTHNLNYKFTAEIDTVVHFPKGGGYFECHVTSGTCNKSVEDSLNQHLVNYKRIRFLFFMHGGMIRKYIDRVDRFRKSDSISVNSDEDRFEIVRNNVIIIKQKISESTHHKVYFAFWQQD